MTRTGSKIALALPSLLLALLFHGPATALECTAPATWTERTVCGSDELTGLHRTIIETESALAAAADPRFRSALAADASAWRHGRDTCREDEYPQACMEQRHYARIETLALITGLVIGPRLWGNPLRGCWQRSESDDDAQACLNAKLADAMTSLGIAAAGVREALGARDVAPGAAGDAVALFEAAEIAFAAHETAACRSEAAALGEGRGRELGGTACRIMLVRKHAVDILRFMPDLAAPWIAGIRSAREAINACIARTGPGAVVGISHDDQGTRIRIETSTGGRMDCSTDKATTVPDDDRMPGEGLAAYTPGDQLPDSPQCGLIEPVTDQGGTVTGRLTINGC